MEVGKVEWRLWRKSSKNREVFINSAWRWLVAGILMIIFAGSFSFSTFATESMISVSISGSSEIDATSLSADGILTTSTGPILSITSNNYTGYTLSISADDDTGNLVGAATSEVISSISATTSSSVFSAVGNTSYNNKWGFLPSKVNSVANTDFLPSPTTAGLLLDKTTSANATANTYTLAFGARTSYLTTPDTYSKTFTITIFGNAPIYKATFNANTTATVTDLPSEMSGEMTQTTLTIPSTTPTREDGYTFDGWCLGTAAADANYCEGTIYQPGATYDYGDINETILNEVNFYALWTDCMAGYICYEDNGADGAIAMADQEATAATATMLHAANFSYTNHGFVGWSENPNAVVGVDAIYGGNETITTPDNLATKGLKLYAIWMEKSSEYTMQTFTATTCETLTAATYDSATGTLTAGSMMALEDTRDGNVYTIARLSDGNCWMTENLRLSDTATESLSSTNTHNPSITSITAANDDKWSASNNTAALRRYTNINRADTSNVINTSTDTTTIGDVAYAYGVYYNYYTATAGNGKLSTGSGVSAEGDICPLNWKLPVGGESSETGSFGYLSLSMGGLNTKMSDDTTPTGTEMATLFTSFPNNFLFSGLRAAAASAGSGQGTTVRYASATASAGLTSYDFYFSDTSLSPGLSTTYKANGRTVRCVVGE